MNHSKAALALNNIGVRLLERHCYSQALETFKEALEQIRLGLIAGHMPNAPKPEVQLGRALSRLKSAEPGSLTIGLDIIGTNSLSCTLTSYSSSIDNKKRDSKSVIAIVMEAQQVEVLEAVDPAILLYNCGIAHQCLAFCSPESRQNHLKSAQALSTASYNVLRVLDGELLSESVYAFRVLHLEAIVLSQLIGLLTESGEPELARVLKAQLSHVESVMSLYESLEQCFHPTKHAAAAA